MSVKRPTNPARLTALDMIKVPETPTVAHIINEFRILYETRQFITMFTTARYGTLLYVR